MGAVTAPMQVGAATIHTIDVLGVYSDHTAERLTDPKAAFVSNIEYANRALQNSGANFRYNLVHVTQHSWANDESIGADQLSSFMRDTAIRALREEYGADIVSGLVPTSNGYCGIGYLPPARSDTHEVYSYAKQYGYSLSGHSCGGRTMAHEMGHNMGLGHSPAQGSEGTIAKWGRGWGVNNSFVSIMAYSSAYGVYSSAGRLQVHSNPLLNVCSGHACGNPISEADGADAVQALDLAAPQISQWFDTVVSVPVNTAPDAVNDSASTDAGTSVTVNVLNNDSDADDDFLTISNVGSPLNGTAVVNAASTSITYTPTDGFDGPDSFTYTITDGREGTAEAKVSIQVNPVEAPPGGGADGNLVVNGDGELGVEGWSVFRRRARIGSSTTAHSGSRGISVSASRGGGAIVDLTTPITENTNLQVSGWIKGSPSDVVYVYLRTKQNGSWRYQYMTAFARLDARCADSWLPHARCTCGDLTQSDRARIATGQNLGPHS